MNRRLTGLVAALVLALVGTLVLVSYVRSAEARALSGEETVKVLVVKDEIKAGTLAADIADKVTTKDVPAKVKATGAITDLKAIKGLVATVDLLPGEQIVTSRFAHQVAKVRTTAVPDDLQQVTVALDPERALGGQLSAGDTVAVTIYLDPDIPPDAPSVAHMVLHKVLVTAVQFDAKAKKDASESKDDSDALDQTPASPTGQLLVTLALDAPSVERVVFGAEFGGIWLSADSAGVPETGTKIVDSSNVLA